MNATLQMTTPKASELHVPAAVWAGVAGLGLLAAGLLAVGVTEAHELVVGGLLALVVAIGLPFRQRWAHGMALMATFLSPVLMLFVGGLGEALIIALLNAFIAVPLIITAGWFWKRDSLPVWLA